MTTPFKLVGVTVSLEVSDAVYGNGAKRFAAFKAETPAESPATLDEALQESLNLHLAAFESVFAAIVSSNGMPVEDYNKARANFKARRSKIAEIFAKHLIESPEEPQA